MPIIAGGDRSERASNVIEQGRELADAYGVELHVVHVDNQLIGDEDRTEAIERTTSIATAIAEEVLEPREFTAVGLIGEAPEALEAYGTRTDAEYIVVQARQTSTLGQALLGSVTQSLLMTADRPIVAVTEGE